MAVGGSGDNDMEIVGQPDIQPFQVLKPCVDPRCGLVDRIDKDEQRLGGTVGGQRVPGRDARTEESIVCAADVKRPSV